MPIKEIGVLDQHTLLLIDERQHQWHYDMQTEEAVSVTKGITLPAQISAIDGHLVFGQNYVYDHQKDLYLKAKTQLRMPSTSTILAAHQTPQNELLLIEECRERRDRLLPGAFDRSRYGT